MAYRQASPDSYGNIDAFGHGVASLIPMSGDMAYRPNQHQLSQSSLSTPGSSMAYGTSTQDRLMNDLNGHAFLPLGDNEIGEWRQYVTAQGYEEPTFWRHGQDNLLDSELDLVHNAYPASDFQGHTPSIINSGRSSMLHTPRDTPEPDMSNVDVRVSTTPYSSKRKRLAKPRDKPKRAALEKPLSELTRDLTHVPLKDMEAWVNRPLEERRKERRDDGAIKRPSNSFMLYRSAFADRCREYEKSRNHQDISSLAGASWAIETAEIRTQYEEWAKVERHNHQKAFPDYKFQPQSQASKDRKRKGREDNASEETTDAEDPSYRSGRSSSKARGKSTRAKTSRNVYREYSNSPSFPSSDEVDTPNSYTPLENNPSYFANVNPGKPLPNAVDRITQPDFYSITSYPAIARHDSFNSYDSPDSLEEFKYHQSANGQAFDSSAVSAPVGLPGLIHDELIGETAFGSDQAFLSSSPFLDPHLDEKSHGFGGFDQTVTNTIAPSSASGGLHSADLFNDADSALTLSHFSHAEGFGI